jgi:hypothetical protein
VVIYGGASSVNLSSVLQVGDSFEIRNVQQFRTVDKRYYTGGSVSFNNVAVSPPPLAGANPPNQPVTTGPAFNAFVVIRIPPPPPSPPPAPSVGYAGCYQGYDPGNVDVYNNAGGTVESEISQDGGQSWNYYYMWSLVRHQRVHVGCADDLPRQEQPRIQSIGLVIHGKLPLPCATAAV